MKKVLRIISSPRGQASVSIKLGNAIIEKIKEKHPDCIVTERNLVTNTLPHLNETLIASFFTPSEDHTYDQKEAVKYSDEAIAELKESDIIVIDTPMYNFTIPSTLKTYLDHIVRRGVTFRASETGIEGLVKNKKVYLAFSSAGFYTEDSPDQSYDFVVPLLKAVLGWLGITDITVVRANGLRNPELQATSLQKGIESIQIA
ncbi:MAG TPA: NAD(P)H-dependent oxidoreductase [Emticicia sp.]